MHLIGIYGQVQVMQIYVNLYSLVPGTNLTKFVNIVHEALDMTDLHGRRPLHYAAANGKENLVRLMLESNASPDEPSAGGDTPLMKAAYFYNKAAYELLREKSKTKDDVANAVSNDLWDFYLTRSIGWTNCSTDFDYDETLSSNSSLSIYYIKYDAM